MTNLTGTRVRIIDHDPDESPALVGQEATIVEVLKVGVRARTDDGVVRWLWREHVAPVARHPAAGDLIEVVSA